jgi:antitoxin (DNA-binding transcriptional repressor) of toxin-antitoxin stability system
MQISLHEAKLQLSALGKKAWAGERIVIVLEGEPYLELIPHRKEMKRRRPGRFKGKIRISEDFTETPDDIVSSFYGENT